MVRVVVRDRRLSDQHELCTSIECCSRLVNVCLCVQVKVTVVI